MSEIIQTLTVYALPVLFAITLHEAAHGYVARLFGDATATLEGRVTLNPLKHIDPIGTIAVPVGILLLSKLLGGRRYCLAGLSPYRWILGSCVGPSMTCSGWR
jgi:Zn-dependent protease